MFMVCCTLVCGLNGCAFFGSGSSNEFRSDEELADEMIEKIIACVEKEDAEGLTELFSPYAKDSTLNLAEQEEDFIDFFQGECESWKGNASSQEKSEHGKTIWRKLRGHYSIITDEAQYEIAYTYIPFHREEPDKEGLTAIEITTEENFDKEDFLWSLDQRPGIYVTEEGEEDLSRQRQITPEELIQAADLTKEQYSGIDLEQFIEDFSMTEEDVDTLNIPLLLKEYEPDYKGRVIDVSYLLEDDIDSRTSDFTSDAIAIAFMENKNTSTECVYYDLLQDRRYQTSDAYLFDNLYQTQAGYCWNWISSGKNNTNVYDIQIEDFGMSWNLGSSNTWAIDPESVHEIGCIHTCQGLEFDYVGVIIGDDLRYDHGIITDFTKRAKTDQSIKGLKGMHKNNPKKAEEIADRIIKNTYRTLLTRGQKGCYIYCVDEKLQEYLKMRLAKSGK